MIRYVTTALLLASSAATAQLASTPQRHVPMRHGATVYAVAFSPNGKLLASGGKDRTVRIWDVSQRTLTRTFQLDSTVGSVAFSLDGARLAAVTASGAIVQWDTRTWSRGPGGTFTAKWPRAVKYSPPLHAAGIASTTAAAIKSRTLLAVAGAERVRIFDADGSAGALTVVGEIDLSHYSSPADQFTMYVNAIAFAPNGQTLATGGLDHRVKFWDTRTWQQKYEVLAAHPADISFARDGKSVASGGDHFLKVWDPTNGAMIRALPASDLYSGVALSPDGRTVAAAAGGAISVFDVASGTLKRSIGERTGSSIYALAFSPDGSLLAGAGADMSVRLWTMQ